MSRQPTASGMFMQPISVGHTRYAVYVPDNTKRILWRNLCALMDLHWGKENLTRLAKEARPPLGQGTATRLKEQKTAVGLDVLERVAAVFHLKPWQLLVPAFDPARPPHSMPMSPQAADAARILDSIEEDEKRIKAHAIFVQVVELGAQAQPSSEPTPKPEKHR